MNDTLTRRQLDVVVCLANGLTILEAANQLFISPSTAAKTVLAARVKLGARTNAHLVSIAIASGALEWHPDKRLRFRQKEEPPVDGSPNS